jgi:adenylate cyclase
VLVTRPVADGAGEHLSFDQIGEVTMKGFSDPTELFVAHQAEEA